MMESTFTHNFLFGFPSQQSDILLHITHWQYWFWFWFTYFLVLYYFLFLRLIRFRTLKTSPKLNTSFRAHGKWGDLIICLLPISWCTNILSNSNFILRMIEWQSESTLFNLRIRGKQWYWIYKFELKVLSDVSSTPKNIGDNFWVLSSHKNNDNLLFFIKQKHSLSFDQLTWPQSIKNNISSGNSASYNNSLNFSPQDAGFNSVEPYLVPKYSNKPTYTNYAPNSFYKLMSFTLRSSSGVQTNFSGFSSYPQNNFNSTAVNSHYPITITRTNKASSINGRAYRLYLSADNTQLLCKFNTIPVFQKKPFTNNLFLVVKQKRFSTPIYKKSKNIINPNNFIFTKNNLKHLNIYFNENRRHSFFSQISTNKRLLRTRRILVLPSHANIGLITNSFDVMHSWFVPGLGIKIDCVPGRSTHHIIYIDHAGFYYGQCAEICGRYHHHMPIRICALPFEHFLLWWYHYGSPFFLAGNQDRGKFAKQSLNSINW